MAHHVKPWAAPLLAAALLLVAAGAIAGMEQEEMKFNAPAANMEMMAAPGMAGADLASSLPPPPANVVRDSTSVTVTLTPWLKEREDREQRRYEATFEGTYVIRCKEEPEEEQQGDQAAQDEEEKEPEPERVSVYFPYPANADTIPEATVSLDGEEPEDASFSQSGVGFILEIMPGQKREIKVHYRAFGTEDFRYALESNSRIRRLDFTLVTTDASRRPVVPLETSLRPSQPLDLEGGTYTAKWTYDNLLTARDIIIEMPLSVVRTDLSGRTGDLVPVAAVVMVLFALVLLLAGKAADRPMGPGEIVLIVLAVLVFYPMLVFLSRHLTVSVAFAVAFVVSGLLVISALRREHGTGFALRSGGFAMIAVLGLLSLAAIAGEASGVLVTISAVLLVAFAIRVAPELRPEPRPQPPPGAVTGPVTEWAEEAFGEEQADAEVRDENARAEASAAAVAEREEPLPAAPPPPERFCAFCGAAVDRGFEYCPRCGRAQALTVRCAQCGFELCRACGPAYHFCPSCGATITIAPPAEDRADEEA